ncbi:MAG: hypothetical protein IH884_15015, partial [Myxococcales bacterium]|nr:hypothetical protein [Myxococcales bacterium]
MKADLFGLVADRLETLTELDRLEARGTLRIALKKAGVDSRKFTIAELEVVFAKIMPDELSCRGATDAAEVCNRVLNSLPSDVRDEPGDSADSR